MLTTSVLCEEFLHLLQGNFEAALKDLAAAVHYDPQNAVAFYHRGCLLRK